MVNGAALNPSECASASGDHCVPADCQWRCVLDVIDEMLGRSLSTVSGEEADLLLDLRWRLRQCTDPDATLRLFCDVRIRMEQRHYLAFFRLRRWLENHLVAMVRVCPASEPVRVPVKLNFYCVEAIRRFCLCAALGRGAVLLAPRLSFEFHGVRAPVRREAVLAGS